MNEYMPRFRLKDLYSFKSTFLTVWPGSPPETVWPPEDELLNMIFYLNDEHIRIYVSCITKYSVSVSKLLLWWRMSIINQKLPVQSALLYQAFLLQSPSGCITNTNTDKSFKMHCKMHCFLHVWYLPESASDQPRRRLLCLISHVQFTTAGMIMFQPYMIWLFLLCASQTTVLLRLTEHREKQVYTYTHTSCSGISLASYMTNTQPLVFCLKSSAVKFTSQ